MVGPRAVDTGMSIIGISTSISTSTTTGVVFTLIGGGPKAMIARAVSSIVYNVVCGKENAETCKCETLLEITCRVPVITAPHPRRSGVVARTPLTIEKDALAPIPTPEAALVSSMAGPSPNPSLPSSTLGKSATTPITSAGCTGTSVPPTSPHKEHKKKNHIHL